MFLLYYLLLFFAFSSQWIFFSLFDSAIVAIFQTSTIDLFSPLLTFFLGLNNLLMAYEDKSAYALCAFSFALRPDAEPITFLGKTPVCSKIIILHSSLNSMFSSLTLTKKWSQI